MRVTHLRVIGGSLGGRTLDLAVWLKPSPAAVPSATENNEHNDEDEEKCMVHYVPLWESPGMRGRGLRSYLRSTGGAAIRI
jgi:hypothetical protein